MKFRVGLVKVKIDRGNSLDEMKSIGRGYFGYKTVGPPPPPQSMISVI